MPISPTVTPFQMNSSFRCAPAIGFIFAYRQDAEAEPAPVAESGSSAAVVVSAAAAGFVASVPEEALDLPSVEEAAPPISAPARYVGPSNIFVAIHLAFDPAYTCGPWA